MLIHFKENNTQLMLSLNGFMPEKIELLSIEDGSSFYIVFILFDWYYIPI